MEPTVPQTTGPQTTGPQTTGPENTDRNRADLAALFAKPLAHRGLHNLAAGRPENSLGAVAAAMEAGFGMEFDVRLLGDGSVVVFHDANLKRLTGRDEPLIAQTRGDILPLRLADTQYGIPLFAELLEMVGGRVPLYVEVKNEDGAAAGPLEQAVAWLLDTYKGPFAVASFGPPTIDWFRENRPHFTRGLIAGGFRNAPLPEFAKIAARNLLPAWRVKPHFIAYELSALTPARRRQIRRTLDLPLMLWTARSEADLDFCAANDANPVFEGVMPVMK